MRRVRLIHWNEAEGKQRAKLLRVAGYEADYRIPPGPALLRQLRKGEYAAVVIDLCRLPSHGREVALAIRYQKSTRHVPLVFLGGDAEKVERIRALLPDATYTEWSRVRGALRQAIAHPPAAPVAPKSVFEAYAGTPLVRKLGIQAEFTVALVGAPAGFAKTLGKLPAGAKLRNGAGGGGDLVLWFARTRREVERGVKPLGTRIGIAPLWILWPKKASAVKSDLTQQVVRRTAMARGLVDYKICSVDETWSGLLFRRKKSRG
jgi:CheY-like chemotaxis protein